MNERIKELLINNPRLSDFYNVGPVQRASVEDFMQCVIDECINEIHGAVVPDFTGKSYHLDRVAEHIEKHFEL